MSFAIFLGDTHCQSISRTRVAGENVCISRPKIAASSSLVREELPDVLWWSTWLLEDFRSTARTINRSALPRPRVT